MYSHILVAVSPDLDHPTEPSMTVAARLLKTDGIVTFLTVVEDIPSFAEAYIPESTLKDSETHAAGRVNALTESAAFACKTAVTHGKAGPAILDYAEDNGADCIIIASHKPGLEDYFIGSTASRVVRHAKCSVHVVR